MKFEVELRTPAIVSHTTIVEADSQDDAEAKALKAARDGTFGSDWDIELGEINDLEAEIWSVNPADDDEEAEL